MGKDRECLDYDDVDSVIYDQEKIFRHHRHASYRNLFLWIITVAIGVATAVTAYSIEVVVKWMRNFKLYFALELVSDRSFSVGQMICSFAVYGGINIACALLCSCLVVYVEPVAGGSGQNQIRAYLNGYAWPRILRLKTLVVKWAGLILAIAAHNAVGKEGPMSHVGAIIGAGFSQGSKTLHLDFKWSKMFGGFKNDEDKRDFVCCGAAAGITAAFGAPIAGVLLILEGVSSVWSFKLTLRTFFCCMVTSITFALLRRGFSGQMTYQGLISGNGTASVTEDTYEALEIITFSLMGAVGGLVGGAFTFLSNKLNHWRRRTLVPHPHLRILEVFLITLVTSLVSFALPFVLDCRDMEDEFKFDSGDSSLTAFNPQSFPCEEGEFNDLATLLFLPQESAVRHLFSKGTRGQFRPVALGIFSVVYFLLAVVTNGSAIPGGIFVPLMLIGCSQGRILANGLDELFGMNLDPGVYALIGASAVLGGVFHWGLSLAVTVVEITEDTQFVIPIMLTVMISRTVSELLGQKSALGSSIFAFDMMSHSAPFLPEESVVDSRVLVQDAMTSEVVQFRQQESVGVVVRALRSTHHNGFPVVEVAGDGRRQLMGIILRKQLTTMLSKGAFVETAEIPQPKPQSAITDRRASLSRQPSANQLHWKDFTHRYNERTSIAGVEDIVFAEGDYSKVMDLSLYMHRSPYTVKDTFPLHRASKLFRRMGLRHLCVCDEYGAFVGILTRKDILDPAAIKRRNTVDETSALLANEMHPMPSPTLPPGSSVAIHGSPGPPDLSLNAQTTPSPKRSLSSSSQPSHGEDNRDFMGGIGSSNDGSSMHGRVRSSQDRCRYAGRGSRDLNTVAESNGEHEDDRWSGGDLSTMTFNPTTAGNTSGEGNE